MNVFCCEVGYRKALDSGAGTLSARGGLPFSLSNRSRSYLQHQSPFGYNISTAELDLCSPFCPVTMLPDGKVFRALQLCPKIHIKKWELIWMAQMLDVTCVCDAKQLPRLSFQITLQVTASKYGVFILFALEVWGTYSYCRYLRN